MSKAIQDKNRLYLILSPLVQFGARCHYNHFVVRGLDKLPTQGAYIIAPCHQQALMEPLAVLNFSPKPPVFLARSDIFARPTVRAILTFLKILPVYRIRDGKENLSKNDDIFAKSRDVLLDGYPLCLMAEGRHNNKHRLLPLVKGMFRIAGETQKKLGDHPLYIVPTGIDFDEYEEPYSNLVVNIGDPIPVQPFMETFESNEPVALNQMRDALAPALRAQMHDIRSEEHYDAIYDLGNIATRPLLKSKKLKNNAWNRFKMRQLVATTMDRRLNEAPDTTLPLLDKAKSYRNICKKMRINVKTACFHNSILVTLLPLLALAGLVTAAVLFAPVRWVLLFMLLCYPTTFVPTSLVVRRMIKDPQFRSSVNYGIRFFSTILYTIAIGLVMCFANGLWMSQLWDIGPWWGLVAVAWAHLGARLSGPTVAMLRKTRRNLCYWTLWLFKHSSIQRLGLLQKEIGQALANDK
ncbi:MAG: 1-acyl-sn-glycerol-3-phosphate acyltransferase [Bacteroidales bacterium]|nr:1-acyl-sn-glycerol-3-phosphate acyltransferase [Bacteroidales bacterium]